MMPNYQANDCTLPEIMEINFVDKFKPKLNKTRIVQTNTNRNKHIYIYIYIYIYIL